MKKWTITDVIHRLLDIAEPIRRGEKPRYKLNAEQEKLFDEILAPQPSFTKQTLRECLQEIGKIIHGEPRAKPVKGDDGVYYYEISYDMFTGTEQSRIAMKRYIISESSQAVDSYASHLDSAAENLINALDKYTAVISEPNAHNFKGIRTETMYVRITDENMIISTQYPIYSIEKLECNYDLLHSVDITPYVFESTVYNSQLSSYKAEYPYSKAYGLMYTQGERNITKLNYKAPDDHPLYPAFGNYAILNILRKATSNENLKVIYQILSFRVTYTPIYNARVSQTKPYYKDVPRGAALIYNQQSNLVESRYYGENLKGTIARIGNIERVYTYHLAFIWDIPKPGQMFGDDYYISAVYVEWLPTYIKCTVGLSKDFNRLSQYIGVSSVKRYSEVSQTQASERNVLYREYIVIGDEETPDNDCFIGNSFMYYVANSFMQSAEGSFANTCKPLTSVVAWGITGQGSSLPTVSLPLISSAFGNSLSFSWEYADNYSAGPIAEYNEDESVGLTGYFQNDYRYTDLYGKLYYYHFDLMAADVNVDPFTLPGRTEELQTSGGMISTVGGEPYILRKDNREKLQVNVQVDFVTNIGSMIIGSALASYCPAVRGTDGALKAKLYVFPFRLNKFIDHVEGTVEVDLDHMTGTDIDITFTKDGQFALGAGNFPIGGKSWAIVTSKSEEEPVEVEDELGNLYRQTLKKGGDVLLAQNIDVEAGQAFKTIYFTRKRKIFDETVWKDIR